MTTLRSGQIAKDYSQQTLATSEEMHVQAIDDEEQPGADEIQAEAELRVLQVDAAGNGMRLDRYLAEQVPEFSRSYLQQLIE